MSLGTLLLELYCIIDDWCKLYDPSSKGPRVWPTAAHEQCRDLDLGYHLPVAGWRALAI